VKLGIIKFDDSVSPWSLDILEREMRQRAHTDSEAIILSIRSGGGYGMKVPEIARLIEKIDKPVIAYVDAFAYSAAYWIAASCDIIIAAPSASVGSVGVYAETFDFQKYYERLGIEHKVFRSGARKARLLDGQMDSEEEALLQADVEKFHAEFIAHVQKHRKIDTEFLQGQTYEGEEAFNKGFVDVFADSINDIIVQLNQGG
jgi:protease-4